MPRKKSRPGIFHPSHSQNLLQSLEPRQLLSALVNGSFEATSANGYTYDPTGTGWIITGNAGIQANGSAFGAPAAADGSQTAFLQSSMGNPATVGQISQTLAIDTAGTYTLSFKGALRSYRTGTTAPQQIALYVDGALVNTFTPTSTTNWDSFSASQNLTVGTHTLTFKAALATGDTAAFLDATSITLAQPAVLPALSNGSFEATNANGYTYDPTGASWTFTGNAGIQANGSAFGAPAAPDGTQTAFVQSSAGNPAAVGQISQTLSVGTAGTCTISFKAALRSYRTGTTAPQQIAVYIDGTLLNTFTPTSTASWSSFSVSQNLTAGTHTLTFKAALAAGDTTAFIDAIGLAVSSPALSNGSFEATNANGYTYDPTGASWTFAGNAGIQANGSAFGAPNGPDGSQTAFLQSSAGNPATVGQISQSFGVSAAGTYTLSFKGALRSYRTGTTAPQQIAVYIDGILINTFTPISTTSWDNFSVSQNLAAGTHTLTFKAAVATGDTTAFLDAVSLASGASVNQPQQFHVSGLNEVDAIGRKIGFSVANVEVANSAGSIFDLPATETSETVVDSSTVLETWKTAGGEATISMRLTSANSANDEQMSATITAGAGWTIKNIDLGAPWIFAPSTPTRKTFSAFQGGQILDWPSDGWYQQTSSVWPQMGYSPIGVFYDTATTEGVGIISFDSGLGNRTVYWYTGPQELHPFVKWQANIASGQSATTTLALHHGFNMPTDLFSYYRNNFLKPFMDSEGVSEGSLPFSGVGAVTLWPRNSDMPTAAAWAKSWGASNYLQYAPNDPSYYEPNPQTLSWYPTLKTAGATSGLTGLGVLINPFMASHSVPPTSDPTDPRWFPGGSGPIDLNNVYVQNWLARLRTDLAASGVNLAYWDSGESVPVGAERAWFNVLKSWKQAGISIAVESSNDLASYVTGTNFFDGMRSQDSLMIRTITPNIRPIVLDTTTTPDATGAYWWDTALARGWVPMLNEQQLPVYGRMHGYNGIA